MKKGISPLIAAVLLIAFVMALAGIISGWIIPFSKEQSKGAVTRGEEEITCGYSGLEIKNAEYNSTGGEISLEVENTGSEPLSDFVIRALYKNDSVSEYNSTPANITMEKGDLKIFRNLGQIASNLERIDFYSEDCPTKSRTWEECKDIEGC